MFVALDKENNRIYASTNTERDLYYCQQCGSPVILKKGVEKAPHFAHKTKNSDCAYGNDKDYKSEWHIHMQEIFPSETREVRFCDEETGVVKHIADIYLKESNTVIEFQHSPISEEDFFNRTAFHLSAGRRVVWVFDEFQEGREVGTLDAGCVTMLGPKAIMHAWNGYQIDWSKKSRPVINSITEWLGSSESHDKNQLDDIPFLSVCVDCKNDDTVHRIILKDDDCSTVVMSVHPILINAMMDVDEFFLPEEYWLRQSPWKEEVEKWTTMQENLARDQRKQEIIREINRSPMM